MAGASNRSNPDSPMATAMAYAAVAWSEETARLARQHNDANVLAIGARTTPVEQIPAIVRAWFASDFEGGRHAERVKKIEGGGE